MKIVRIRYPNESRRSAWEFFKLLHKAQVTEHAACLAYTLLFSLFPLLIVIGSFIGHTQLSSPTADVFIKNVLPTQLYRLIRDFLDNAQWMNGTPSMVAGIVSIYSTMRVTLLLKKKLRQIYGAPPSQGTGRNWKGALLYSIFFLGAVLFSLVVLMAGEWVLDSLAGAIGFSFLLVRLWLILRFALIGVLLFGLVFVTYRYLPSLPLRAGLVLPGTLFSTFSWVAISAGFSFYVDNLHDYSLIYGSIGVGMVLLLWLYLTGLVLLSGACLNWYLIQKGR